MATIETAGHYWLSFAADGTSDSFGGQIDAIELCRGTCSDSVPATYRTGITGAVSGNQARDSNIVGLFVSHAQLAGRPIGGGERDSTTSYLNPSGTTIATPTVPPNGVSLTS